MVSSCSLISMSPNPFTNPLGIVPSVPITIGITVTFMFNRFLVMKQGLDIYLSFRFLLILLCGLPGRQSLLFGRFSFYNFSFLLLTITLLGRLSEIMRSVCISKSQRTLYVSFSKTDSGLCIYHIGQILISCTIPSWLTSPPSCVKSYTFFALICCIR